MVNLTVRIQVEGPEKLESPVARIGLAELDYVREVSVPGVDGSNENIEQHPSRASVTLAMDGSATIVVDDAAERSSVVVRISDAQGNIEYESGEMQPEVLHGAATLEHKYPVKHFKALISRPSPSTPQLMRRSGFFVLLDFADSPLHAVAGVDARALPGKAPGDEGARFLQGATLHVAAIENGSPAQDVLAKMLSQDKPVAGALRFGPEKADGLLPLRAITFSPAILRPDGAFQARLELPSAEKRKETGWAWLIIAKSAAFVGFQPDEGIDKPRSGLTIVLPPAPPREPGKEGTAPVQPCTDHCQTAMHTTRDRRPPLDFDEQQVLRNPGQFGEDIGTACAPFSNPNRVLGERRFATILRVETPSIGGGPSLHPPVIPSITDISAPSRGVLLAAARATAVQPQVLVTQPSRMSTILSWFRSNRAQPAAAAEPAAEGSSGSRVGETRVRCAAG